MSTDYLAEAITEAFGERCPDYAEGCHACEAWKQYDAQASDLHTLRTAIFGSDNYDHTLPVSYFVAMLEAERRQKDDDYFGSLVAMARTSAAKASAKFPQPNYVTLKIAEEAGEVVRGAVHYAENRMEWSEVEGEIVQLIAMLIRFVTEGDLVNGIVPPARQNGAA